MINIREVFGKNLKRIRKDRKLTQQELADLAGISVSTIIRAENFETMPQDENLEAILSVLGCTLQDLNVDASSVGDLSKFPPRDIAKMYWEERQSNGKLSLENLRLKEINEEFNDEEARLIVRLYRRATPFRKLFVKFVLAPSEQVRNQLYELVDGPEGEALDQMVSFLSKARAQK